MATLYHFFIVRKAGTTREAVEKILDGAPDWFRYSERCYIVETSQSPRQWFQKLKPLVHPSGYLFIVKFDEKHYYGLMSSRFWKWYQSKVPEILD